MGIMKRGLKFYLRNLQSALPRCAPQVLSIPAGRGGAGQGLLFAGRGGAGQPIFPRGGAGWGGASIPEVFPTFLHLPKLCKNILSEGGWKQMKICEKGDR